AVRNSKSPTEVQISQRKTFRTEFQNKMPNRCQRFPKGVEFGDLRANVASHADNFHFGHCRGASVKLLCLIDSDTELILLQAGGYIRMGAGIDSRICTNRYSSLFAY